MLKKHKYTSCSINLTITLSFHLSISLSLSPEVSFLKLSSFSHPFAPPPTSLANSSPTPQKWKVSRSHLLWRPSAELNPHIELRVLVLCHFFFSCWLWIVSAIWFVTNLTADNFGRESRGRKRILHRKRRDRAYRLADGADGEGSNE